MPTKREQQILDLIRQNPLISQRELADELGISRPGVASHISHLTKAGLIRGKGYILPPPQDYVTVIGATNMDVFGTLSRKRVMPTISNPGKIEKQLGGMGRNIAANLAALDVDTRLITVVGDDADGEAFKRDAVKRGIGVENILQLTGVSTATYLYVDRADGQRVLSVDDMTINDRLTPTYLREYLTSINNSRLVIFDSNLSAATISWLYENVKVPLLAKAVSVNKVARLLQKNLRLAGLVINGFEAEKLVKTKLESMEDVISCAHILFRRFHTPVYLYVDNIGLANGAGGRAQAITFGSARSKYQNGMGTAIVAAVSYGMLHSLDITQTLNLALAAAERTAQTKRNVSDSLGQILK